MDFNIFHTALSLCILFVNISSLLTTNPIRRLVKQDPTLVSFQDMSVLLKWEFVCNDTEDLIYVKFRPKFWGGTRGTLKRNHTTGIFLAERDVNQEVYESWQSEDYITSLPNDPPNGTYITVYNLWPKYVYELEAKRITKDCVQTGQLEFRTAGYYIYRSPRIENGSFQVYDVNATNREVRIYWPQMDGPFFLNIYEAGEKLNQYPQRTPMEGGSLSRIISMQNHTFDLGGSPLFIPAQSDILAAPLNNVDYVLNHNITMLRWLKPAALNERDNYNYTVFWIDSVERGIPTGIIDFVSLPKTQTTFAVEADRPLILGLSVNTESSSSGIHIGQSRKED